MYARILTIATVLATLSGCSVFSVGSGDYGCKGLPEGATCMSARDVYAATHNGAVVRSIDAKTAESVVHPSNAKQANVEQPDYHHTGFSRAPFTLPSEPTSPDYLPLPMQDEPYPVRTASKVMRIWIAPWEDKNGDLNASGHVYTEIESRKWTIGHRQELSSPVLTPLQIASPSMQAPQQTEDR